MSTLLGATARETQSFEEYDALVARGRRALELAYPKLAAELREEIAHEACVALWEELDAGARFDAVAQREQWVAQVARRKAADVLKHEEVKQRSAERAVQEHGPYEPVDLDADPERAALRRAEMEDLLRELTSRERAAIGVRFCAGFDLEEAAVRLGVVSRTLKRILRDAIHKIGAAVERGGGVHACSEKGRELMIDLAAGGARDKRRREAEAHHASCEDCAQLHASIERVGFGAGMGVPPLALEQAGASPLDQIAAAGTSAKEHASSLFSRLPGADTVSHVAATGGLRGSGPTLAAFASTCAVVVGGGAYCAVENVTPVGAIEDAANAITGEEKPEERKGSGEEQVADEAPAEPTSQIPVVPGPGTAEALEAPKAVQEAPAPASSATRAPATPEAQSGTEFGFDAGSGPAPSGTSGGSSAGSEFSGGGSGGSSGLGGSEFGP